MEETHIERPLISSKELARRLGISYRRVLSLANAGLVPVVKVSPQCFMYDYQTFKEALFEHFGNETITAKVGPVKKPAKKPAAKKRRK